MMEARPAARRRQPLVWSQPDDGVEQAGVYSSAGITGDLVIYTTYSGRAVGIDRATGAIRWEKRLPGPLMGSPVIVDGVWLQGDCAGRAARVRRARHRRSTRPSSGRCRSAAASRRRRPCGTAASTWAPAAATSTPSPTRDMIPPPSPKANLTRGTTC